MNRFWCVALLVMALQCSASETGDILGKPVTLKTESDLVHAIMLTLQHAVSESEQYRGKDRRLQRFARREIEARRKTIDELSRLARVSPTGQSRASAVLVKDDQDYLRAMLRNHARQIELFEYGAGITVSKEVRRFLESLYRTAAAEFDSLSEMSKS